MHQSKTVLHIHRQALLLRHGRSEKPVAFISVECPLFDSDDDECPTMEFTVALHVSRDDVRPEEGQRYKRAENLLSLCMLGDHVCDLDVLPLCLGFTRGMVSFATDKSFCQFHAHFVQNLLKADF